MACNKSRSTTGSKALWKWTNHTSWWCNSSRTARRGRIQSPKSSLLSNATTSIWWLPIFKSSTIESCFRVLKVSSIRRESTKCKMLQPKPTSTIRSKSWDSKLKNEFPTCSRRARYKWIVTWDRWNYWRLTTSIMRWASSWFFKREIFMWDQASLSDSISISVKTAWLKDKFNGNLGRRYLQISKQMQQPQRPSSSRLRWMIQLKTQTNTLSWYTTSKSFIFQQ